MTRMMLEAVTRPGAVVRTSYGTGPYVVMQRHERQGVVDLVVTHYTRRDAIRWDDDQPMGHCPGHEAYLNGLHEVGGRVLQSCGDEVLPVEDLPPLDPYAGRPLANHRRVQPRPGQLPLSLCQPWLPGIDRPLLGRFSDALLTHWEYVERSPLPSSNRYEVKFSFEGDGSSGRRYRLDLADYGDGTLRVVSYAHHMGSCMSVSRVARYMRAFIAHVEQQDRDDLPLFAAVLKSDRRPTRGGHAA